MAVTPEDVQRAIDSGASQEEVQRLVNELAANPPVAKHPLGKAALQIFGESGGIADNFNAGLGGGGGGGGIGGGGGLGI